MIKNTTRPVRGRLACLLGAALLATVPVAVAAQGGFGAERSGTETELRPGTYSLTVRTLRTSCTGDSTGAESAYTATVNGREMTVAGANTMWPTWNVFRTPESVALVAMQARNRINQNSGEGWQGISYFEVFSQGGDRWTGLGMRSVQQNRSICNATLRVELRRL